MSAQQEIKRLTAPDIRARKGGEPIVSLTSYHAHTARLVDKYCDVILVGDSLGMVMHGLETTVPVTLDMMILQGHAVMRGSKRAMVVVDMPFGSYEASREQAFMSAAQVMKETGCGAIKLEGGRRMAESIAFLVERGVPVMGHVGLTPQSINTIGSFRAQGRSEADWGPIEDDARAVTQACAFALPAPHQWANRVWLGQWRERGCAARVRHFSRSRRGSSTRTAQEAVGPLRQLRRGCRRFAGFGGCSLARLHVVGGQEGCRDRRRLRSCHHARRVGQTQRG